MSEKSKRKQLIVRLPPELHEWLKKNVNEGTINDFIVGLIQEHVNGIEAAETEKEQWYKPEEVTSEIRALVNVRESCRTGIMDEESRDAFHYLEKHYFGDSWYEDDQISEWKAKIPAKVWQDYFERALKLSDREQGILYSEARKKEAIFHSQIHEMEDQ